MAARRRAGWAAAAGLAALLAAGIAQPLPGRAADPSPPPSPSVAATDAPATGAPATCAERYPADGPAGIDLLLGCVVGEVMRAYTGAGAGTARNPPRASQWLGPIAVGAGVIVLMLAAIRSAVRSAGRRLAPAAPTTWWSCPGCRSLNAAGKPACYRCGRAWEAGAAELSADAEPPAPQSFGRRYDL